MARIYLEDFVVEYSLKQNAFNILTLREMLIRNQRMIVELKFSNDFLVVGVARTREEADALQDHFLRQLEESDDCY
jgi:hypothetical protein